MSTKKLTAREKKALQKLENQCHFLEVIRVSDYGECIEFVVNRWGDICTFRVYNNGEICER